MGGSYGEPFSVGQKRLFKDRHVDRRLQNKTIIVTGGASGMGAAQVARFATEGARVIVADRDEHKATEVAASCEGAAIAVALDVRSEQGWAECVARAAHLGGGSIDGLVNNAGILREETLEETSYESYRLLIDVMQDGVFLGMRAVAPFLRRAGGGSIVNISSTAGLVGYPKNFAYVAAKFAVRGMTKAAALDLAADKIRVNSVHPGNTDTPMIASFNYPVDDVPLKRNATADEIASLALFLLGDESKYITGAEHAIDGGYTAY